MSIRRNWSAIAAVAAWAAVALAALTAAFQLGQMIGALERRLGDLESQNQPMYVPIDEECPQGYAKHPVTWRQSDGSMGLLGRCDPP